MQVFKYSAVAMIAVTLWAANCSAQQTDDQSEMLPLDCVQVYEQLRFAEEADPSFVLDLYVPEKTASAPPLLVWIHGRRQTNSKSRLDAIMFNLTDKGYAVASLGALTRGLGARSTDLQVCKVAIRSLQAQADRYGYDASRIGVAGGAGGERLALLLGMTAGVAELEGSVAGNLDQSSRVHAVVCFFERGDESESRNPNLSPNEVLDADSPLKHLTPDDAPLLAIQGNHEGSVQPSRGQALLQRYQEAGLEATLCTLQVVGHGGAQLSDDARFALLAAFFDKHIKQIQRDIFAETPPDEVAGNRSPQTDRNRRREEFGKRFAARGAQVGEKAPDATVHTLAGERLQLSSLWKHKPTVLVTGSITCPIAYRNCPSLRPLQDDYGDAVNVVMLYQREAHPKRDDPASDRRASRFRGSTAEKYPQPRTQAERLKLAKVFDEHMSSAVRIVVADISDEINETLGTGPNMGLLIDRDGKIVAKQGWYDVEAMRKEIVEQLVAGPK